MEYASTEGVFLNWKLDQTFVIHIAHHFWFDGYNYRLYIEYNYNQGSLLLQQYPESIIHNSDLVNFIIRNSDLLNLIPCELDLTSTPWCDTNILTYEIDLPPDGKKIGVNLLDEEDFSIPYVTDTIPKLPAGYQLPTQGEKMCGSFLSMEKSISYFEESLMKSISIKPPVENTMSRSVYAEKRYTRGHKLKIFVPYLFKSYLWFHIMESISQRNLSHQITLVKL